MIRKVAIALVSLVFLAGMAYAADRLLSRPDRIRLAKDKVRLSGVREAILRFKLDNRRFPIRLEELAPTYIAEDLLVFHPDRHGVAPLLWEPRNGVLSWSVPFKIQGLMTRRERFSLEVPDLPVMRDSLEGECVFRQDTQQIQVTDKDVVIEPELFQFMTYGWEIGEAEEASGNCYLHIKEGTGDLDYDYSGFDPSVRSGNFYNIGGDRRKIEARCYFMVPETGWYRVYARVMAHREHCSNIVWMRVNDAELRKVGRSYVEPFIWRWYKVGIIKLQEGPNSFTFMTFHDDVKIDQIVLFRRRPKTQPIGDLTFGGGYAQPPVLPDTIPAVNLSLRRETTSVFPGSNPEAFIYLHKNVPDEVEGILSVGLGLSRSEIKTYDVRLSSDSVLTRFPCEITFPAVLDKKEYLLTCQFLMDSGVVSEQKLTFFQGYDWSILGPLPFMKVCETAAPERDARLRGDYIFKGKKSNWQKYDSKYTDHYCVMDFGRMFSGRTYNAISNVSLYGYTEVEASEAGEYMLKAMGDDHLIVWVNGVEVVKITDYGPAIRTAREPRIRLNKGRNRILFRLNQRVGQWQAGIRIRTPEDGIADVKGIPFSAQDVGW